MPIPPRLSDVIYCLVCNDINSSDYVGSNGSTTNEEYCTNDGERSDRGLVCCSISKFDTEITTQGLRIANIMGRDLNPGYPTYEAGILTNRPRLKICHKLID